MSLSNNRIVELRKQQGLTQEELADKSGVNLRTIQRIEKNENMPRGKTLQLICDALDVQLDEIITDSVQESDGSFFESILNMLFLLVLNLLLMAVIGFMTFDSEANINSVFGGVLVSIFLPLCIVYWTPSMKKPERLIKFGSGYLVYFFWVLFSHGFAIGFKTGLFPCLLLSVSVLYFGNVLVRKADVSQEATI